MDYKGSRVPKNGCFWTVMLDKTLESPLDCKESNQSILKEISPKYSLEGLMLNLILQYFGHLMWRSDSLVKTLIIGKIEGGKRIDNRGWDGWMASPTWWTWVWVSSRCWWWTGKPGVRLSTGKPNGLCPRVTELDTVDQLNWTDTLYGFSFFSRL